MPVQTTFHPRDLFSHTLVHPSRVTSTRRYCSLRKCLFVALLLLLYVGSHVLQWPERYSRYRRVSAEQGAYRRALKKSLPLVENTQICSLDAVDLLWVIVSSSSHFRERQAIRQTWASMPDLFNVHSQRLFVVGYHLGERFYPDLIGEAAHEQDLLYLPVDDRSTTLKELHAYRWAERHCAYVKFTFKAEDDLFVNSFLLHELIRELNTKPKNTVNRQLYNIPLDPLFRARQQSETRRFLFGWAFQPAPPERNNSRSPYFVSREEYSAEVFPQYCSGSLFSLCSSLFDVLLAGFGYLMDATTRNILASQGLNDTHPFRFPDIFITGILPQRLSFTCDILPFTYHQGNTDQCQQMLTSNNIKEPPTGSSPPLIVCSTGRHVSRSHFADYFQIWSTLKQVYADRIQTSES